MKRLLCAAAALLLAGCAAKPAESISAAATLETASDAVQTEVPEPAEKTSETGLKPNVPAEDTNYSAMLLPRVDFNAPFVLAEDNLVSDGYYAVCQDGKWGLIKSDGTLLLPCRASRPVSRCDSDFLRWHYACEPFTEEWQACNDRLAAENAGALCSGEHDGFYYAWTYDIDSGRACKSSGVMGGDTPLSDKDRIYGEYLPCQRCVWIDGDGDLNYYETAEDGGYVFANADGKLLSDTIYEDAGCFYDQSLAPVKLNGKWGYMDKTGSLVTEAVYEPVYGTDTFAGDGTLRYASPLLYGYAAVCRDGKWGVLDAAGTEYIPCRYEYAAWNGHTLWLKENGAWQSRTLPGVPDDWAETISGIEVSPQTLKATDTFWQVTTDAGLNLRTGPDTSYGKLGTVPEYTCLQDLGHSKDDGWILTKYAGRYGWVSRAYLEEVNG